MLTCRLFVSMSILTSEINTSRVIKSNPTKINRARTSMAAHTKFGSIILVGTSISLVQKRRA